MLSFRNPLRISPKDRIPKFGKFSLVYKQHCDADYKNKNRRSLDILFEFIGPFLYVVPALKTLVQTGALFKRRRAFRSARHFATIPHAPCSCRKHAIPSTFVGQNSTFNLQMHSRKYSILNKKTEGFSQN